MKTVSCGITLYNPSLSDIQKIYEYINVFEIVYVFDNTENEYSNDIEKKINYLKKISNVIYYRFKKKLGLAIAFNTILESCNSEFLCTLDQDSIFNTEDIIQIINKLNNLPRSTAIISPKVLYKMQMFQKKDRIFEKKWVITSGAFMNVNLIKSNNIRFDENYFIDRVDIDICKQIVNKNLHIYEYENSVLYQQLGEKKNTIFGKKDVHSPLRHYYIFRNRLYYNDKYNISKITTIIQIVKHVCAILFYEDKKIEKIKVLKKARNDYAQKKYGKYV